MTDKLDLLNRDGYLASKKRFDVKDLDIDCADKTFLVTGASSGIGRCIVAEIARKGLWQALSLERSVKKTIQHFEIMWGLFYVCSRRRPLGMSEQEEWRCRTQRADRNDWKSCRNFEVFRF